MNKIKDHSLRFLFALCFFLNFVNLKAQRTLLYCEDFDSSGLANSAISLQVVPVNATVGFWADSLIKKGSSGYSATDTAGIRSSSYMIMPRLKINNYDSIFFRFDQLCYLDWFDAGVVEYTFDGVNWSRFPRDIIFNGIIERVYKGGSLYQTPQLAFTKLSNPAIWQYLDSSYVWTAANSQAAWVTELFDASPVIRRQARNTGFQPDSIQFRLGLIDIPASPPGRSGTHQWWIDNICIEGSNTLVGLKELDQQAISIYPNPVHDLMQIRMQDFNSIFEYRIVSISGKVMQTGWLDRAEINLEFLPDGLYLLEIHTSSGNLVKKFLKQ